MRDDAARALRVDDDVPRLAELRAVTPDMPLPYEFPPERRFAREPSARPASVPAPRTAPGRSYGSHGRGDSAVAGHQPGRRTVAITGQTQHPRRRSHTAAAMVARPDRTALWAFLFALFLVVMAIATAHA